MKFKNIKNYLNEKITNSWYKNAEIDYGITGKFLDCEAIENDLLIIWEEMEEKQELIIADLHITHRKRFMISGWKWHKETTVAGIPPHTERSKPP